MDTASAFLSVSKVKAHTNPNLAIDGILLTLVDNRTNLVQLFTYLGFHPKLVVFFRFYTGLPFDNLFRLERGCYISLREVQCSRYRDIHPRYVSIGNLRWVLKGGTFHSVDKISYF